MVAMVLHQTFRSQNTRQRGTETVPFYIDFLEDRFDIIVLARSTQKEYLCKGLAKQTTLPCFVSFQIGWGIDVS